MESFKEFYIFNEYGFPEGGEPDRDKHIDHLYSFIVMGTLEMLKTHLLTSLIYKKVLSNDTNFFENLLTYEWGQMDEVERKLCEESNMPQIALSKFMEVADDDMIMNDEWLPEFIIKRHNTLVKDVANLENVQPIEDVPQFETFIMKPLVERGIRIAMLKEIHEDLKDNGTLQSTALEYKRRAREYIEEDDYEGTIELSNMNEYYGFINELIMRYTEHPENEF